MPIITHLDANGFGIAKDGKKKYAVPTALPGEMVSIERFQRKKKHRLAFDYTLLSSSLNRVNAPCPYFGSCGGCRLQHMPYQDQLSFKVNHVHSCLEEMSLSAPTDIPITGSPQDYGYKNRLDIAVTDKGIGFRTFGSWWKVIDIDHCLLFSNRCKQALDELRQFMQTNGLKPWNLHDHVGDIRYMTIREGKHTGELMIILVSAHKIPPEGFSNSFTCDSLYWLHNDGPSDVADGALVAQFKKPYITEMIGNIIYHIHPKTFFQTNTIQAEQLVMYVTEQVSGTRVCDLYCGVGTFALALAKKGHEVTGIELNETSISYAKENAQENGIKVSFFVQNDKDVVELSNYDTVVVDPPRAGLHPDLLRRLVQNGPEEIVYVSCNPKSLSENLQKLGSCYTTESIHCFDMFPQTPHVETVVVLRRIPRKDTPCQHNQTEL